MYKAVPREVMVLAGISVLAGIALIGIIAYRLITPVSDDTKKNLSYAELGLSFVTSFQVLLYSLGLCYLMIVIGGLTKMNSMALMFIICAVVGLLINPFTLTLIRLSFKDKLNDTLVSTGVIVSSLLSLFINLRMAGIRVWSRLV